MAALVFPLGSLASHNQEDPLVLLALVHEFWVLRSAPSLILASFEQAELLPFWLGCFCELALMDPTPVCEQ
jgi:hypothetical protein